MSRTTKVRNAKQTRKLTALKKLLNQAIQEQTLAKKVTIAQKMVELAEGGNTAAMRMLLDVADEETEVPEPEPCNRKSDKTLVGLEDEPEIQPLSESNADSFIESREPE